MQRLGFGWKRITVAEIEAGAKGQKDRKPGRKVSLEELVGLAALFAVPMLEFILPDERDVMVSLFRAPSGAEYGTVGSVIRELILGRGGSIGHGGPEWAAAHDAAGIGEEDWRPVAGPGSSTEEES